MEGTAYQEGEPIYESDSVNFLQLVVDQVKAPDGRTYEVFFIVADLSGEAFPIIVLNIRQTLISKQLCVLLKAEEGIM